jgi:hypothetical protein
MLKDIALCDNELPIKTYCEAYDRRKGFERGTALRVLGLLLWSHKVEVDLEARNIPQQILTVAAKGPLA